MAKKDKKNEDQPSETHPFVQITKVEAWASIVNNLINKGCLVGLGYFGYLSIASLAGKVTLANIVLNFMGNLVFSQGAAYVFGAGGIGWAVYERRLAKRKVERLQSRVKELERRQDPKRTSSLLTPKGETNPKDRG